MSFTPAQQAAIAARGNVLVVAGAGTGKTSTLVERCLSCLLHEKPPASFEEILMVSFTEAAAAEMRHRIRARLEEEVTKHPDNLRWAEQLALFDTAHIGTLHSFCLQLVRQHFYELELDPQLTVLAEEEAEIARGRNARKHFRGALCRRDRERRRRAGTYPDAGARVGSADSRARAQAASLHANLARSARLVRGATGDV